MTPLPCESEGLFGVGRQVDLVSEGLQQKSRALCDVRVIIDNEDPQPRPIQRMLGGGLYALAQGQSNAEGGALSDTRALCRDAPSVHAHEALYNGKAETQSGQGRGWARPLLRQAVKQVR